MQTDAENLECYVIDAIGPQILMNHVLELSICQQCSFGFCCFFLNLNKFIWSRFALKSFLFSWKLKCKTWLYCVTQQLLQHLFCWVSDRVEFPKAVFNEQMVSFCNNCIRAHLIIKILHLHWVWRIQQCIKWTESLIFWSLHFNVELQISSITLGSEKCYEENLKAVC